jgi:hypothetical protein
MPHTGQRPARTFVAAQPEPRAGSLMLAHSNILARKSECCHGATFGAWPLMLAFGNIHVVERAGQQVSTVFIRG